MTRSILSLTLILVFGFISSSPTIKARSSCTTCNCPPTVCDADPILYEWIPMWMEEAYAKNPDESDTCGIANYVRDRIQEVFGNGWVVMIGSNRLLTNRLEFDSAHTHIPGTYLRFSFMNKHDIEVFQTVDNSVAPSDKTTRAILESRAISPRLIENITSDMEIRRKMNFQSITNNAFKNNEGKYHDAAIDMWTGIQGKVCDGEWVFVVGSYSTLSNPKKFCIAKNSHNGTNFRAQWSNGASGPAHEVISFAPKYSPNTTFTRKL